MCSVDVMKRAEMVGSRGGCVEVWIGMVRRRGNVVVMKCGSGKGGKCGEVEGGWEERAGKRRESVGGMRWG